MRPSGAGCCSSLQLLHSCVTATGGEARGGVAGCRLLCCGRRRRELSPDARHRPPACAVPLPAPPAVAKGESKRNQVVTREYTINLHKRLHGVTFKKRAPKAIKEIKKFATQMMNTSDVRVDVKLNKAVWSQVRGPPRGIAAGGAEDLDARALPERRKRRHPRSGGCGGWRCTWWQRRRGGAWWLWPWEVEVARL